MTSLNTANKGPESSQTIDALNNASFIEVKNSTDNIVAQVKSAQAIQEAIQRGTPDIAPTLDKNIPKPANNNEDGVAIDQGSEVGIDTAFGRLKAAALALHQDERGSVNFGGIGNGLLSVGAPISAIAAKIPKLGGGVIGSGLTTAAAVAGRVGRLILLDRLVANTGPIVSTGSALLPAIAPAAVLAMQAGERLVNSQQPVSAVLAHYEGSNFDNDIAHAVSDAGRRNLIDTFAEVDFLQYLDRKKIPGLQPDSLPYTGDPVRLAKECYAIIANHLDQVDLQSLSTEEAALIRKFKIDPSDVPDIMQAKQKALREIAAEYAIFANREHWMNRDSVVRSSAWSSFAMTTAGATLFGAAPITVAAGLGVVAAKELHTRFFRPKPSDIERSPDGELIVSVEALMREGKGSLLSAQYFAQYVGIKELKDLPEPKDPSVKHFVALLEGITAPPDLAKKSSSPKEFGARWMQTVFDQLGGQNDVPKSDDDSGVSNAQADYDKAKNELDTKEAELRNLNQLRLTLVVSKGDTTAIDSLINNIDIGLLRQSVSDAQNNLRTAKKPNKLVFPRDADKPALRKAYAYICTRHFLSRPKIDWSFAKKGWENTPGLAKRIMSKTLLAGGLTVTVAAGISSLLSSFADISSVILPSGGYGAIAGLLFAVYSEMKSKQ